jgi:hypothetical protein
MFPETVAEKFRDPSLFCSSVLILLIDNFGTEVLDWEPETIYMELEEVFKVKMNNLLADKINASCSLLSSDLYHKSLEAFTTINSAFSFKSVSAKEFNFSTLEDVMWGVSEARMLEGPELYDAAGFSHDISRYTAELLSVEGISKPPDILKFSEFNPTELDQRDITLAGDGMAAEAYWRRQEEERAKLEEMATKNMQELIKEVQELPLKNGEASLPESCK